MTPTLTLAPNDIAHVRASIARITMRQEQATMAFEYHLNRYAPTLARALKAQGAGVASKFIATLSRVIMVIDMPDIAQAQLADLAHRLRVSGMSPRGYMAIHAALMDMVVEHIGDTPEVEEAWSEVIGAMLGTMVAVAHGPRSYAMPLAA